MDHAAAITERHGLWFEAVMAGDTAPFAELLADDFCYVDIFGAIRDAAGYHALLADIPVGALTMKLGGLETRTLGDLVHVVGDYTVDGSLGTGKDISSHTRFTALWRYDGTAWRCHAHHATTITGP